MDLGSWLSHCWGDSGSGRLAGPASPSSSFPHFLSPWEPPFTPPPEGAQEAACYQGPQSLGSSDLVKATSGAPWEGQGKRQPPN